MMCAVCPARAVFKRVCEKAELQFNGVSIDSELPLIGQTSGPPKFVCKSDMIAALQCDVQRLSEVGIHTDTPPTGHSLRRSGAKHRARKGDTL